MADSWRRRLPIGAEVRGAAGVHFRVWAPLRTRVDVVLSRGDGGGESAHPLAREEGGYWSGVVDEARAGSLYRFRLDGGGAFPDPASRFQPEGPHGPSMVVDPAAYAWKDAHWRGTSIPGQVIYELHVGTLTREGTWRAAIGELARLADLGVTLLEVMPVADFPGAFGWGYDGVNLYAPTRLYGTPDDFRAFVDEAHAAGLGVLLDVVYNHIGPDGNYLGQYASSYVTKRYENDWGEALNFDGEDSGPVRQFFIENAGYWIDEFHLDGLRLDATQTIFDRSREHVLAAIGRRARDAARSRSIVIVAENEAQAPRLVRTPERGGYGLDALWNDDFHHSAVVAMTGRREAYYSDHLGTPQELVSATKWGYLFQGQHHPWQKKTRGAYALDLPATSFVTYLENHDQVASSGRGARLHTLTTPGRYRAMTALLLLAPATPMLFQGQEHASSTPFLFFADHVPELAENVRVGRAKFLSQFPSLSTPEVQRTLDVPHDRATFERCKIDPAEREKNRWAIALHRDLLRLRREDPAFSSQRADQLHGAVIAPEAFLLRFMCDAGDRIMVVNLGRDLDLPSLVEPLVAPPHGADWDILWCSESTEYGGMGYPKMVTDGRWTILGHGATVLMPKSRARGR
jgi:maltooligosyltrehalose trehalohydrolase